MRPELFSLETDVGPELDALEFDRLQELADAELPGGREGIAFRGYLRRVRRGVADIVVRPLLLAALARRNRELP